MFNEILILSDFKIFKKYFIFFLLGILWIWYIIGNLEFVINLVIFLLVLIMKFLIIFFDLFVFLIFMFKICLLELSLICGF